MILIKITLFQKNFLFDEVIKNDELLKKIESDLFLLNNVYKFSVTDILLNDILAHCYEFLFTIGFNEKNELTNNGKIVEDLIDIFNKELNTYYAIKSKSYPNTLLYECVELLGNDVTIIKNSKEHDKFFDLLTTTIPFYGGKVDWDKIKIKSELDDPITIINFLHNFLKNPSLDIIIYWDRADAPVIKTKINNALRIIDDVTAVDFNTWIFCPESKYVIEFTEEIRIGIID